METSALKLAVRDSLRADLVTSQALADKSFGCDVTEAGRPVPAYAGLVFISVHGGSERGIYKDNCFGESIGLDITISMKTARVHKPRLGDAVIDNTEDGLEYVASWIKRLVQRHNILIAANQILTEKGSASRFQTGVLLRFQSGGTPKEQEGDWWNIPPRKTTGREIITASDPIVGFSKSLSFAGAEHYREIEVQEWS